MGAVADWQQEADALYFSLDADDSAEREESALAWPDVYINNETKKPYTPHHPDEENFVYSDGPRFALAKGGEGGGKSVAGIIKDLERLRRGMSGILGSSDLQHLKKSLWPEFRRWCPPEIVVRSQRYRLKPEWEPQQMFTLTFTNRAQLICGGFDDPTGWEGPNVNFAHWDEARRHKTPAMLKVLNGRVRIPGPNGEPPQLYLTTTPAKHWLFDYFGPVVENDPQLGFKRNSLVITLLTIENERAGNVAAGFTEERGHGLTENEKKVLLDAEWEDVENAESFLASMTLWDACLQLLPPLDAHTPVILAMDAGESNDTFATILVSRHPDNESLVAARYARAYVPTPGVALNFDEIEADIRDLCGRFAVHQIAYDPMLLGQMMRRLTTGDEPISVPCEKFHQGAARLESDKLLFDLITQRRISHDGDPDLRQHIANADKKQDADSRKLRIVKRMQSLKIDLAVCLSMGCERAYEVLPEGIRSSTAVGGSIPGYGNRL
jgi:Phage Terminase